MLLCSFQSARFSFPSKHKLVRVSFLHVENFQIRPPAIHEIHKDYEFLMFQQQYVLRGGKNVVVE